MTDRYNKLHEQVGKQKRSHIQSPAFARVYWAGRGMKCHLEYKGDMRLYEGERMMEMNKDVGKVRL